jgi:hypothetical protein
MDPRLFTAVVVVVGVPAVLVGYIYATELGLRLAPAVWRDRIRPWFWLAPALLLLAIFLILPTIGTIVRSFQNTAGTSFVGLENYTWFFGSDDALIALRNSALWVIFLTAFCVGLGTPHRGPRRSGPVRVGRQVRHLRAARDQHGRGRRDLAVHVRRTRRRAHRRPGS